MKYKIGDIVVVKMLDSRIKLQKFIIARTENSLDINQYYMGYTECLDTPICMNEKRIIVNASPQDIIVDDVITKHSMIQTLDPNMLINEFFYCVMIHLMRTSDKYDLQILNKCINLKSNQYIGEHSKTQEVLDMLILKTQLNISGVPS